MDPNKKNCTKCDWNYIYSKRFGFSFPCIHTALSFDENFEDLIPPTDNEQSREIVFLNFIIDWDFPKNVYNTFPNKYDENVDILFDNEDNDVVSFLIKTCNDFCHLNGVKKSKEKMLSEISMQWAIQTNNKSEKFLKEKI